MLETQESFDAFSTMQHKDNQVSAMAFDLSILDFQDLKFKCLSYTNFN